MKETINKSAAEPTPAKPASTQPSDIASASVPAALAVLHVNPDTVHTHAEVNTPSEGARLQRIGTRRRRACVGVSCSPGRWQWWGLKLADALIAAGGSWHNPMTVKAAR